MKVHQIFLPVFFSRIISNTAFHISTVYLGRFERDKKLLVIFELIHKTVEYREWEETVKYRYL